MAKKRASRQRREHGERVGNQRNMNASVKLSSDANLTEHVAPKCDGKIQLRTEDERNFVPVVISLSSSKPSSAEILESGTQYLELSREIGKLRESLGARFEELLRLTRMYQALEAKNVEVSRNLANALSLLDEQRAAAGLLEEELAAKTSELLHSEKARNALNECFRVAVARTHKPEISKKGKGIARSRLRIKSMKTSEEWSLLTQSWLFDGEWYLLRYPDVAQAEWDPVEHYLRFGAKELRDPGPCFSTACYLDDYADVAEAEVNPLIHYIKYGSHEHRVVKPSKS